MEAKARSETVPLLREDFGCQEDDLNPQSRQTSDLEITDMEQQKPKLLNVNTGTACPATTSFKELSTTLVRRAPLPLGVGCDPSLPLSPDSENVLVQLRRERSELVQQIQ
jgi:hypothetical protein